jgi:hypothetical protein
LFVLYAPAATEPDQSEVAVSPANEKTAAPSSYSAVMVASVPSEYCQMLATGSIRTGEMFLTGATALPPRSRGLSLPAMSAEPSAPPVPP